MNKRIGFRPVPASGKSGFGLMLRFGQAPTVEGSEIF
jgi:hypothetical protein